MLKQTLAKWWAAHLVVLFYAAKFLDPSLHTWANAHANTTVGAIAVIVLAKLTQLEKSFSAKQPAAPAALAPTVVKKP